MMLKGKLVRGLNKAAFFVNLDWVQVQCMSKLGFRPYPGTLNLELASEAIPMIERMYEEQAIELVCPDPAAFCSGKALPANLAGLPAAVLMPDVKVRDHDDNIVELIAAQKLIDVLGVKEGDFISFDVGCLPLPDSDEKLIVDAAIFDLDGTLIDSTEIYLKILAMAFDKIGLPRPSRRNILEALKDGQFNWQCVLPPEWKYRTAEVINKTRSIRDTFYLQMFGEEMELIPGADQILKKCSQSGMTIGLVTSTTRQDLYHKMQPLKRTGVHNLFEVIITTDDVGEIKPAPEPLIECAKRLGIEMHRCVYIGDARIDIQAGKSAGMRTIGVLTGFDDLEALKNENPDAIINSVNELEAVIRCI